MQTPGSIVKKVCSGCAPARIWGRRFKTDKNVSVAPITAHDSLRLGFFPEIIINNAVIIGIAVVKKIMPDVSEKFIKY